MEDKVSESSVKVAVRIRPQLARERIEMCRVCTNVTPNEPQVVIGQDKAFTFDYVFDMDISQHHIYDTCASKLIEGMFDGFNATILAYGQTGSGKTYTMGTAFDMHVDEGESKIGIIPRAVEHLFMGIEERRRKAQDAGGPVPEFTVNTQFMELYNEELFDLLDTTRDPSDKQRKSHVKIHEDGRGEIFTVGITTRPVTSLHETLQLLKAGTLSRTTASTNMNTQSSRSHAIFTILMRQQRISSAESQPADVEVLTAKFNFVDLAGSERLKRTGATGDRAKEGISINCGLLALGNVISALGDEEKQGCHVPYRDSKLTRLLQDSLGGNSCTTMIACISPSDCDFVETLSTLKYANRARNIRNKVVVNQDSTSRQLSSMRAEIQMLQQELMDFRTGRRVADSECISDVVRENEMLRVENLSLRQRSKALQDTIDSLTKRNTQLVTEREQMSLTARIEGGDGDSGDGTVGKLIESYVQQIEQLQSSLIESNAVADSLRQSVSTPRYASSAHNFAPSVVAASVPVDVLLDDDGHVQQLIDEAKDDVMKLKQLTERAHTKAAAEDGEKMDPDENANLESNLSDSEAEEDECHKLNEKLADLLGEISIKQKLIDELELSQKRLRAMRAQYEEKLGLLAKKIRETETERDKVLSGLGSASKPADDANVKKVRADYDAKLGSLQTELRQLQAAKREHSKLLRNQTHYETQMRTLKADLVALKQLKVKLMKQLQEEAQKSRQTEQRAQKTIAQLEKQKRMKETMIKSLETERQQKDIVLKRKMEEVAALRKQQKAGMSAKAAGRVAKYSGRSQVDGGAQPVNEEPSRCDVSAEEEELDPRMFKSSWLNLEKIINSVIVKRQTLTHLDKEMDRWIKQREAVGKKLDRLLKAQEKAIASDVEVVNLSDLNEQIDTLRDNMTFIQDNINDCQNSIVDLEEFQEEEVEADKIFVTSSLTEAMYLLEHCTDLAVNNGLAAALKTVECHELEAKLQQEQMENVFQRDVLSYLIQDKVELAADGGTPWQENEDDSDEPSYSLSPVDSLEDRGETTPFKLDTQLAEKDLTANVTNPLIGISPAVDEQQRTTAFVEKAALPSSQQQDKTKPDLSVKKTPVASRAVKKPVSQQPPDTSAASSAARPRSASSMVSLSPMRRPRSAKPSSPETPQSSANVESTGGRPVDPSPVKAVPIPTAARGVISSPAAGSALPPRGSCPLVHRHTAVGHTKAVLAVCASDTIMCSAGKDHTAKIWDLTAGVEIRCLDRHVSSVVSVKYNPAESLVYTASAYLVKVWDTRQADCLHTLTSAGLTSEGRLLDDNDLSKPVCCPPGEINIAAIALGNRNNTLYSAAGNTVRIWDLRMLRAVGKLYGGHNAAVMALTVNDSAAAANTCVVTGSKDRCLKMFQTSNDLNGLINPRCAVETAHSDGIQSLVLNGSVMFSGARDMGIVKWDVSVDSLQLRQSIPNAHRDWICGLACLPSSGAGASGGPLLLSACRAGVLKVWNSANCALLGELQAHIGSVNDVTSCASTLSAFTASADRTIRIWKVVDGN